MGGKDALAISHAASARPGRRRGARQLRQASVEANLAPQLASLSQQYEDLASRETRGAFSGLRGEGSVVATLRNMSQMFANLSRTVKGVDAEKRSLYDRYKELAAEARKVAAETEAADVSESDKIRRNNLASAGSSARSTKSLREWEKRRRRPMCAWSTRTSDR